MNNKSGTKSNILVNGVGVAVGAMVLLSPAVASNATGSTENLDNADDNSAGDSQITVIETKPNLRIGTKQQVPFFFYWTDKNLVHLNWDYGGDLNRPNKIEVVVDKSLDFSSPQYVRVKPEGASFEAPSSEFYLRVRFYDKNSRVTNESIRKVITKSGITREIVGLEQEYVDEGLLISWSKFKDGIKSGKVYVNGEFKHDITSSDIARNAILLSDVPGGSEVNINIVNGKGLEYNGFVFVNEQAGNQDIGIALSASQNGTGIEFDFAATSFKAGNRFLISVKDEEENVVVKGTEVTLDRDKGSFVIFPDAGRTLVTGVYDIAIKDLNTGRVYNMKYNHKTKEAQAFSVIALPDGTILSGWSPVSGMAAGQFLWATSPDLSDISSVDLESGQSSIGIETDLKPGDDVYAIMTTVDEAGRIITQNFKNVKVLGKEALSIPNFKGRYINDTSAQFSFDKIGPTIVEGLVDINGRIMSLSDAQMKSVNEFGLFNVGGLKKGSDYEVSAYLVDENGNLHVGTSGISESGSVIGSGNVILEGVSGISAKYVINPGILTLLLDKSQYKVQDGSPIGIFVDGEELGGVNAKFVNATNGIDIVGLVPTKAYNNMKISYVGTDGSNKLFDISKLLINDTSVIDSFVLNMYTRGLERPTQGIDEQGYNYWKYGLINKDIGLSYFVKNLAFVPEFMSSATTVEDVINRLYRVLVLRDSDPKGFEFWSSVYNALIANGVSHTEAIAKLISEMTVSTEFANLAERLGVNP